MVSEGNIQADNSRRLGCMMGKAAALFGIASWGVVARPQEWPGWIGLAVAAFVLGVIGVGRDR
jgi:hypothetical protein